MNATDIAETYRVSEQMAAYRLRASLVSNVYYTPLAVPDEQLL